MKVLLAHLVPPRRAWPIGIFRSHFVPTGLAYVASALKRDGHQVRLHVREEQLIKVNFDWPRANAILLDLLLEFRPEIVGLSVTSPAVEEAQWLARKAKEHCGSHVLVVAGGAHPTALPEATLAQCPDLDAVVIGEGEQTMVELARNGLGPDVAGICYRRDGIACRTTPRAPQQNLDDLSPIDYGMMDMKHYTAPGSWMIRWLDLSATNLRSSRGCPNRCRFCAGHLTSGLGVRLHSVDYVMERMHYAVEKLNVQGVHFEDDTLGADRERLLTLCDAIRRSGLDKRTVWDGCLRVDQAEPELLKEMKSAGCIQIEYGFESGSDATLKTLGKNATAELNRRAVALTRQAGLRIFADIMIGLPGERRSDVSATMRFLRWARPEVLSPARLYPLPGTPIFDQLPQAVREAMDWSDYAYLTHPPTNLTAMSDSQLQSTCREFFDHFADPWMQRQILRDSPQGPHQELLRWRLRRFKFRHPVRYLRLPR